MAYSIHAVDPNDDEVAHDIRELHKLTFAETAPLPDLETEPISWWLVYYNKEAVAFAGMQRAIRHFNAGYLVRSGVLHDHRGNKLQRRLLRVREAAARRRGWATLVTDTTGSVASSNNLIAAGYRIYEPQWPWAFSETIYWRKNLAPKGTNGNLPRPERGDADAHPYRPGRTETLCATADAPQPRTAHPGSFGDADRHDGTGERDVRTFASASNAALGGV